MVFLRRRVVARFDGRTVCAREFALFASDAYACNGGRIGGARRVGEAVAGATRTIVNRNYRNRIASACNIPP